MTEIVGKLAEKGKIYLQERGISEPELSVQWLLSDILGISHLELPLFSERVLTKEEMEKFLNRLKRRGEGEPVQYILGYWEFRGFRIKIDRRALIPRPETEQLTEEALKLMERWKNKRDNLLLDLGTGSGVLAISLALECPEAKIWASDISEKAVSLARENAQLNGVINRIEFAVGDLFEPFEKKEIKFDLIVSNPPYIPREKLPKLSREVLLFEPISALNGGPKGISILKKVLNRGRYFLKKDGAIICEIDISHGEELLQIAEKLKYTEKKLLRDFTGRKRFLLVKK